MSRELDLILGALNQPSKLEQFGVFWERLEASSGRIDLDALSVCIKLLPSADEVSL
jgi:hypothetical protein